MRRVWCPKCKPYCRPTDRQVMIAAQHESWALAEPFTISRGTKTSAEAVVVKIDDEDISGRGECDPYGRYNESIPSVLAQIETTAPMLVQELNRAKLHKVLPAAAARNALDCALWDLISVLYGPVLSRAKNQILDLP